ncbi:MAG: hypothetical protein IPL28_05175 [Chloroflexi bacterium]|nr:hypothetical protein [Chloroflexota bacterium]
MKQKLSATLICAKKVPLTQPRTSPATMGTQSELPICSPAPVIWMPIWVGGKAAVMS